MNLTEQEQKMLNGDFGAGTQLAMEVIVRMGELYGAKRLLRVKNAHIDAAAYTTIWEAGTEFLEYLAENGARVPQPTTINPLSRDIKNWKKIGQSEEFAMKSKRMEDAYLKMGVIPTWTCAPYQCTNLPQFGEIVSWSESNAVNFVNSVIGARAERLPDLMDVCCAVTGRVPEYGLYLTENRKGDILFKLEGFDDKWFQDCVDYAVLGYLIGEIVINKVPVIEGMPKQTTMDELKAFSAAAASGGAVSLFHMIGLTPEAPTTEAAFQNWEEYETKIITTDDMKSMEARLNTAKTDRVDMVLVGCPHSSAAELMEMAELIAGQKVADGTQFWITTSETQYALACRCGASQKLEEAGAVITRDTCVMELDEGDGRFENMNFVTNSGKVAQYAPGINKCFIRMATTKGCIEAAVTGKFPKEAER